MTEVQNKSVGNNEGYDAGNFWVPYVRRFAVGPQQGVYPILEPGNAGAFFYIDLELKGGFHERKDRKSALLYFD